MRSFYKTLLALYILGLLWLVLFKSSVDIPEVLHHQIRNLNLIPFAAGGVVREMIDNMIIFLPLGLLLRVNFKQTRLWHKLAFVSMLSIAFEAIQYVLAIGVSDITDVIMNTLGGLVGLVLYGIGGRFIDSEKLDHCIVVVTTALLMLFLLLRFFVFRVKY